MAETELGIPQLLDPEGKFHFSFPFCRRRQVGVTFTGNNMSTSCLQSFKDTFASMLPTEIILVVALNHVWLLSFIEVPDYSCASITASDAHLCPFQTSSVPLHACPSL